MNDPEVLDAEPVPEHDHSTDLAVASPSLAVAPSVSAAELVTRLDGIREAQERAMQKDVDYGVIPGTNKPALLKPGAEKLGVLFQLDIQPETTKTWGPGDHLTVEATATVYHAPTGTRLGKGEGVCSTREKKYAKRKQERVCPHCGTAAVIKGKQEYGGGWICFKKKDGCGAKWPDGAEEIESQQVGEIENPDLPDTWNTVTKMAKKRAVIDAVLAVTGASALFTQDVDEQHASAAPVAPGPAWADEASDERKRLALDSLTFLLGEGELERSVATTALGEVKEALGVVPEGIAVALSRIARVVQESGLGKDPSDVPWSPDYQQPELGDDA